MQLLIDKAGRHTHKKLGGQFFIATFCSDKGGPKDSSHIGGKATIDCENNGIRALSATVEDPMTSPTLGRFSSLDHLTRYFVSQLSEIGDDYRLNLY